MPGGLDAAHRRHTDVYKHEVGIQRGGFFNRLFPVHRFAAHFPAGL